MAKQELLATIRDRYRASSRKEKSRILDEFIPELTSGGDRPPDYPTASQTRARSVPERLWLHAALAISPSAATAGRQHRSCVATSRRPHPLYWNQARPVRLPLPIIPCVNATAHRFGGFGLSALKANHFGGAPQAKAHHKQCRNPKLTV